MKTRIKYFYKCWGGKVPSHHQAHSVEIEEAGGKYTLWDGSGQDMNVNDINEAEELMMKSYTNVIRTARQIINTWEEKRVIKK